MKKILAALLVTLPLAALAQYEPVPPPEDDSAYGSRRNPWYIGFGLGTGGGNVSIWGESYTLDEMNEAMWLGSVDPTDVSFNFKIGATLSEQLLVGLDVMAMMSMVAEGNASTSWSIVNYDAVATWFPQGEGFFLRGGAGISKLQVSIDDPDYGVSDSETWSGVNALVGVGYALWLGQAFNLTLNADYSIQSYGSSDTDPESSNFFALWVGFDWY